MRSQWEDAIGMLKAGSVSCGNMEVQSHLCFGCRGSAACRALHEYHQTCVIARPNTMKQAVIIWEKPW